MASRSWSVHKRPARGLTRAVVLVLNGGRSDSFAAARPWHLSALRMVPFAAALSARLAGRGVAVWSLTYRYRGWNGAAMSPVADARDALELINASYGQVPVVILGHSMGGRTALRVADDPQVGTVVALAPWLPEGEPVRVAGCRVQLVHGTDDRWTDPEATLAWARRARPVARWLEMVKVSGVSHFMLRRSHVWSSLATDAVLAGLEDAVPGLVGQSRRSAGTNPLQRDPRPLPSVV